MIRIVTVNKETGETDRCQFEHLLIDELKLNDSGWKLVERCDNYAVLQDNNRVRVISEI